MTSRMKVALVLQASVVVAALAAIVVIVIELFRGGHSTGGTLFGVVCCLGLLVAALSRIIGLVSRMKHDDR
jgi:hypothetical protein